MPRSSARRTAFPRITLDVVRYAYEHPAQASPYYIREVGRDAIRGCMLRVHRRAVELGTRYAKGTRWHRVTAVDVDMSVEELEAARFEIRRFIRSLEDEEEEPSLHEGRLKTVQEFWEDCRAEYVRKRSSKRSPRTLEFYDYLWNTYLLPAFGSRQLRQVTTSQVEALLGKIADRVQASRPWAEGRHTANHVLNQGRMLFEVAHGKGWILRNPFAEVEPFEVEAAQVYLRDVDLTAVGQTLREMEAQATNSSPASRHVPGLGSLLALRVVIYTGCRHREELLYGSTPWLCQDFDVPRLEVPRAKGDRGDRHGRFLYLGPHGLECLLRIPRPPGSTLLVPGRVPGRPLYRLNETWAAVLFRARAILRDQQAKSPESFDSVILRARLAPGEKGERVPVKTLRHTAKTLHPRAGIAPEHSAQLLGHEAESLGERVYLHRHDPSLVEAATVYETFVRQLLGDFSPTRCPRVLNSLASLPRLQPFLSASGTAHSRPAF
jgi:hypothetical protein